MGFFGWPRPPPPHPSFQFWGFWARRRGICLLREGFFDPLKSSFGKIKKSAGTDRTVAVGILECRGHLIVASVNKTADLAIFFCFLHEFGDFCWGTNYTKYTPFDLH
jgi:hypothetical protein